MCPFYFLLLFFKLIFIGVLLLYNVVLVSAVERSESAICMHVSYFFKTSSHLGHREEFTCQYRRLRFDPWVGKFLGEGNGNPLQSSCLENPMDRGAWWVTARGVTRVKHD